MKRLLLIPAVLLAMITVSCQKAADETGYLVFDITSETSVTDEVRSYVSDYTSLPAKKDFAITIRNSTGETVWSGALSKWSTSTKLPVGYYSVNAVYGTTSDEGADKPCFSGDATFTITGAETTSVNIPVSLQNCIVRFTCTDNFKNYFTSYSFTVTTGAGKEFTFNKNAAGAIFIDAYKMILNGQVTNQGGQTSAVPEKIYDNLQPATCYTLKMDATNVGGLQLIITFNNTVETIDLGDIEIND